VRGATQVRVELSSAAAFRGTFPNAGPRDAKLSGCFGLDLAPARFPRTCTIGSALAGSAYKAARVEDLERQDGWSPIRRLLDVRSFGVNAWTAHEVGATVIPNHDERPSGHEELYLVTAGRAAFTIQQETVHAAMGTLIFVPDPGAVRGAVALETPTTVLSIGGEPGKAYAPRSWETDRDVFALLDAGRYAEAKELLLEALDEYDDASLLLFNLACAEAQLGEIDAALEHLGEAVRLRPTLAADASKDDELKPLRDDPRFGQIVAA
jgi:tetratricopeptide (TPR) repeat protein